MTLGEIRRWITVTPGQQHAIGRYQIIPSTLDSLIRRNGLPLETVFSAAVRDQIPAIEVPVPPLETQRCFDRLQAKARQIHAIRAVSAHDADALIPALLHEIFNGKAVAA